MFILLRFKSHQTLYIPVSLAQSLSTLLSYSICLWNLSCHIQCEWYFERWYHATLLERWFLCSASLRDTNIKYWIGYLGVLPECKSWNCQTRVINKAKKVWPSLKHVTGEAGKFFTRILCNFCIHHLLYGHVLVSLII